MRNSPAQMPVALVLDPRLRRNYDLERDLLAAHGIELRIPSGRASPDDVRRADVVLVHLGPVSDADVAAMTRVAGIVVYGVGVDAADSPAVRASGITVRSVPDYCIDEVSDHAIGLVLASERRIVSLDAATRAGEWAAAKASLRLRRLRGRSLGIVGVGRIGREIVRKAQVFGLRTLAHDPYAGSNPPPAVTLLSFDELVANSDILVLSVPLNNETRHLMDRRAFALMRPGSLLVNVARGPVVDEAALIEALDLGRPAFAALDVREQEPPPADDPLAKRNDVILTPHIGASSVEAAVSLSTQVAETAIGLVEAASSVVSPAPPA